MIHAVRRATRFSRQMVIAKKMDRGSARTAGPAKPEKWTGEGVAIANERD